MATAHKRRIGLLGGTFNPIHTGHLILAQSACERHDLEQVWFMPCATPPHKEPGSLLPAVRRYEMVQAAIEGDPRFSVSDAEIRRGGVSFAIDTLEELAGLHPDVDWHFIIGDDTLLELHLWHRIYDLLALCTFVTFSRLRDPGTIGVGALKLDAPWPERLLRLATFGRRIDISSTDIRYRVAEGLGIRYLVPDPVAMYIAEHRLY
jgi:nicotinate-nucleotide adenylyltransferase